MWETGTNVGDVDLAAAAHTPPTIATAAAAAAAAAVSTMTSSHVEAATAASALADESRLGLTILPRCQPDMHHTGMFVGVDRCVPRGRRQVGPSSSGC